MFIHYILLSTSFIHETARAVCPRAFTITPCVIFATFPFIRVVYDYFFSYLQCIMYIFFLFFWRRLDWSYGLSIFWSILFLSQLFFLRMKFLFEKNLIKYLYLYTANFFLISFEFNYIFSPQKNIFVFLNSKVAWNFISKIL